MTLNDKRFYEINAFLRTLELKYTLIEKDYSNVHNIKELVATHEEEEKIKEFIKFEYLGSFKVIIIGINLCKTSIEDINQDKIYYYILHRVKKFNDTIANLQIVIEFGCKITSISIPDFSNIVVNVMTLLDYDTINLNVSNELDYKTISEHNISYTDLSDNIILPFFKGLSYIHYDLEKLGIKFNNINSLINIEKLSADMTYNTNIYIPHIRIQIEDYDIINRYFTTYIVNQYKPSKLEFYYHPKHTQFPSVNHFIPFFKPFAIYELTDSNINTNHIVQSDFILNDIFKNKKQFACVDLSSLTILNSIYILTDLVFESKLKMIIFPEIYIPNMFHLQLKVLLELHGFVHDFFRYMNYDDDDNHRFLGYDLPELKKQLMLQNDIHDNLISKKEYKMLLKINGTESVLYNIGNEQEHRLDEIPMLILINYDLKMKNLIDNISKTILSIKNAIGDEHIDLNDDQHRIIIDKMYPSISENYIYILKTIKYYDLEYLTSVIPYLHNDYNEVEQEQESLNSDSSEEQEHQHQTTDNEYTKKIDFLKPDFFGYINVKIERQYIPQIVRNTSILPTQHSMDIYDVTIKAKPFFS